MAQGRLRLQTALPPACAALYRCLEGDGAPPARAPAAGGQTLHQTSADDVADGETTVGVAVGAGGDAVTLSRAPWEESEVGEALCARGDLGPFPCLEDGCEPHGVAISCARLAKGKACDEPFTSVWRRPQRWMEGLRAWEACPVACGLCGEAEPPPSPQMGSCDA